ncbi:sensor histidine kinase [Streptomyces sp. WMMC897]|uniref:sensor histidine kinase n=1 Tax=Streptomyces sp. WMMC897 TaxID=3014782 RepID=UPI0022B65A9B|nr:nitrate- and nitrite sensing domain-containing protein [Streptomyces sp. WMMC897]MCZ7416570.1 nitrate- and nitrite sensing domain-containing protein [Streptomyces sp. WMMC897]
MQRLRVGRRGRQADAQDVPGRRARVRNRLLASVALCTVAVLAAGVPSVVAGSSDVAESQELVDQADVARRAVSLAHAVADERDGAVRTLAERGADSAPEVPEADVPEPGVPDPGVQDPGLPGSGVQDPGLPGSGVQDPALPGSTVPGTGVPGTVGATATPGTTGGTGSAATVAHPAAHTATGDRSENGPDAAQRSRVDRKVAELRSELPGDVRALVDRLPELRQQTEAAKGGAEDAQAAYSGYTAIVLALGSVSGDAAGALPARARDAAGAGTAVALPYLGRAVAEASGTRGLLLGVLTAQDGDSRLVATAQEARVRERTALADFERHAPDAARERFSSTVNGTDVTTAETYLGRLADRPRLDDAELDVDQERVASTLTARVDRMRGLHSSLAGAEVARLEQLRDDDVTALQLRFALLGAAVLLAAGVSISTARSMARPLAAVRRGSQRVAADPVAEEPVRYTGSNDEFADVVRAVNALREAAVALAERAGAAEADAAEQSAARDRLAAERRRLTTEREALREELDGLSSAVHGTFVRLALRSLGLVERQLALIESMEEKEDEPGRLSTLFRLDHMATRMRRHGENLLLMAGAEHTASGHHPQPVSLLDVLRAAVSEIERYERVELTSLPPHAQVAGHAADDVSHLVAELLDNATSFSPPDADVELSGWLLENGEVMLSVQDTGIGMAADRLVELNDLLGEPADRRPRVPEGRDGLGLGLHVVARLAARHGVRVQLRAQREGGITAVAVLPSALLPDRPAPGTTGTVEPGTATATGMPGSVAEANSNALPTRASRRFALRKAQPEPTPEPAPGTEDEPSAVSAPESTPVPEPEPTPAPEPEPTPAPQPSGSEPSAPGGVRLPGQTAEPDEHARAEEEPPTARRLTDKGLPKRTPHVSAPTAGPAAGGAARSGVNAEELRRRLGGFQRGARAGLREAAAQLAADPPSDAPSERAAGSGQESSSDRAGADDMGGTEEARQ